VILVDTGPLVALFDPRDRQHAWCVERLRGLRRSLRTTAPVLTEAFHMLPPATTGAIRLREFIAEGGLGVWHLDDASLTRAFELMEVYADHPMDLADASLVAAGESLGTRAIFTLDRDDFHTYRVRRGHRLLSFEVVE
jgi:predicted nucleic acid-binding protein